MLRYARLYLYFVRFSTSRAFEFRVDFFFRIVMDSLFYAVNLAFFTVVYRHTTTVGGWSLDEAYVFVCAFLVVDAIHMTIYSSNVWWLPIFINRGDLDYYLVRPVSPLFFLSLRDFSANSAINLAMAGSLLAWSIARYPAPLGAVRVSVFCGYILLGSFVYYLVRMLFLIPVFWLRSGRGLDTLFYAVDKFAERPHQIYGSWVRRALLWVVPLALVASVPTHVLFEGATPAGLAYALGVTGALFGLVVLFWRRGLRAYGSASS